MLNLSFSNKSAFAALLLALTLTACDAAVDQSVSGDKTTIELAIDGEATGAWSLDSTPEATKSFETNMARMAPVFLRELTGDASLSVNEATLAVSGEGKMSSAVATDVFAFYLQDLSVASGALQGELLGTGCSDDASGKAPNCDLSYVGDGIMSCNLVGSCGGTPVNVEAQSCHCMGNCHQGGW